MIDDARMKMIDILQRICDRHRDHRLQAGLETVHLIRGTIARDGIMSCSITSQKMIKDINVFLPGSTPCRAMDEFVHLSAYAICA